MGGRAITANLARLLKRTAGLPLAGGVLLLSVGCHSSCKRCGCAQATPGTAVVYPNGTVVYPQGMPAAPTVPTAPGPPVSVAPTAAQPMVVVNGSTAAVAPAAPVVPAGFAASNSGSGYQPVYSAPAAPMTVAAPVAAPVPAAIAPPMGFLSEQPSNGLRLHPKLAPDTSEAVASIAARNNFTPAYRGTPTPMYQAGEFSPPADGQGYRVPVDPRRNPPTPNYGGQFQPPSPQVASGQQFAAPTGAAPATPSRRDELTPTDARGLPTPNRQELPPGSTERIDPPAAARRRSDGLPVPSPSSSEFSAPSDSRQPRRGGALNAPGNSGRAGDGSELDPSAFGRGDNASGRNRGSEVAPPTARGASGSGLEPPPPASLELPSRR